MIIKWDRYSFIELTCFLLHALLLFFFIFHYIFFLFYIFYYYIIIIEEVPLYQKTKRCNKYINVREEEVGLCCFIKI